ncbi:fibrinogen-like protein A [Pomacea canaliculata]|uniref:fibrinogen-like protein A n=1 Tax=Pomacea canaliculata TaxID=400727 RepID=UPI000D739F3F|nr:fibrinogen-like protein A [Pomacea canaliculata]
MQDSFTEYPDSALRANLIGSEDGLTVEDCKGRCQTNKTCLTFDFKASGGLCRLHGVTAHESPSYWSPKRSKGWTHYQKSCKSTFASNDNWYNLLCNSKIDCHHPHSDCLSGRCLCHSGFHFNQDEKECVVTRYCADLLATGAKSGVYTVQLDGFSYKGPVSVWCDMDTAGGGWTVIQRRRKLVLKPDEYVDFNRNWTEYLNGFGNLSGDFWLGLGAIHELSWYPRGGVRLRVELATWTATYWAQYDSFTLYDPGRNYSLYARGYSGTAGNAFTGIYPDPFQTYDRNWYSCVTYTKGPWWYKPDCASGANLFSPDKLYMTWADISYVEFSEMKIKPRR